MKAGEVEGSDGLGRKVSVLLDILRPSRDAAVHTVEGVRGSAESAHRHCTHDLAMLPTATLPSQGSPGRRPRQTALLPSPPFNPTMHWAHASTCTQQQWLV